MVGRDDGDPLFLQVKEAEASVLEPYLGPGRYANHGQRVVEGQRLMQAASDILLGWQRATGSTAATRLLRPPAVGQEGLGRRRGHGARRRCRLRPALRLDAGPRPRPLRRPVAIAAYLGASDLFDRAMAAFAEAYADQNARDHAELERAIADGEIAASPGI